LTAAEWLKGENKEPVRKPITAKVVKKAPKKFEDPRKKALL